MTSAIFVKWVGGNGRLLPQTGETIKAYVKHHTYSIYVEPFVGSNSVLIDTIAKQGSRFKRCIASDINQPLITTFKEIQYNHEHLIRVLCKMSDHFFDLARDGEKEYY